MGRDRWETAEEQAIRRKNRLRLAVVGPLAVLIAVIAIVAYVHDDEQGDATESPAIAPAFVGEWHGVTDSGGAPVDVVLTIAGGDAEQSVRSVHTEQATGARCEQAETVVEATDTGLTLTARSADGAACADGTRSTVRLNPAGSLDYHATPAGAAVTGTLTKR